MTSGARRFWTHGSSPDARARLKANKLVLYANSAAAGVTVAQVLAFNLKQVGIDVDVRYFDTFALLERAGRRGEPFDLITIGWAADYADPAAMLAPLLGRGARVGLNLDDPTLQRRIDAANRLTGEDRRRAWADLDVDLMRNNPPWAPYVHTQSRTFVSKSVGCVLIHPVYGFDIAAVCKK
jgi:ABC-type transport system substrate-binding protein